MRQLPRLSVALLAVLVLLLLHISTPAQAWRYAFRDNLPVCFVEEPQTDKHKLLTGSYDWKFNARFPVAMRLTITDPIGLTVKEITMEPGLHPFLVSIENHVDGAYTVCAVVTTQGFSTTMADPIWVEFNVDQVGESHFTDEEAALAVKRNVVKGAEVFTYTDFGGQQKDILQPKAYLESVQRNLNSASQMMTNVKNVMEHLTAKESRMRSTTESTFTRIWICALLVMAVTTIVVWLEFRTLKTTLKKKKLI